MHYDFLTKQRAMLMSKSCHKLDYPTFAECRIKWNFWKKVKFIFQSSILSVTNYFCRYHIFKNSFCGIYSFLNFSNLENLIKFSLMRWKLAPPQIKCAKLLYPEHILFTWIVLRTVIWHFFWIWKLFLRTSHL